MIKKNPMHKSYKFLWL